MGLKVIDDRINRIIDLKKSLDKTELTEKQVFRIINKLDRLVEEIEDLL